MSDACQRRIEAAAEALADATAALYASGKTDRSASLKVALRRATYEARATYLQAKNHTRQVGRDR